jgi:hypothetical protein
MIEQRVGLIDLGMVVGAQLPGFRGDYAGGEGIVVV